jgi:uncharacterized membrane protein
MESHKRSILKALTWRVLATMVTILVVYFLTKKVALSLGAGFIDATIKVFIYYAHERVWDRTRFGRRKEAKEDYTI